MFAITGTGTDTNLCFFWQLKDMISTCKVATLLQILVQQIQSETGQGLPNPFMPGPLTQPPQHQGERLRICGYQGKLAAWYIINIAESLLECPTLKVRLILSRSHS